MACVLDTPMAEELAPRVVREDAQSVLLGFTLDSRHLTRPRGHALILFQISSFWCH